MQDLIKFRIEKFSAYGLNKHRNFLSAPECDCGCGNEHTKLLLKDRDELFMFMGGMLIEHGCPDGAIFAISYDDHMYAAIMNEDGLLPTKDQVVEMAEEDGIILDDEELEEYPDEQIDPISILTIDEIDLDFFAEIDGEFRRCCYGLIIETKPGRWKIVEE